MVRSKSKWVFFSVSVGLLSLLCSACRSWRLLLLFFLSLSLPLLSTSSISPFPSSSSSLSLLSYLLLLYSTSSSLSSILVSSPSSLLRLLPLHSMFKKKSLHQPLFFWSTPTSTPELSPTSSSSDSSDSDEDMDPSGPRPLSLAVSSGAFCPMRPSLDEVLANTAPPPYTLTAFMAYLSQNHCLETLEFTLEAKRYRETYDSLSRRLGESPITSTDGPESKHLRMLWGRLMSNYVCPGSPREINLSSEVRDGLVRLADSSTPPDPHHLDRAVKTIRDLMEESIFFPFLNSHSVSPTTVPESLSADESVTVASGPGLEEHAGPRTRTKGKRLSPQSSAGDLVTPLSSGQSPRLNIPRGMAALGRPRLQVHVSSTSGDSATLTDDSGSLQSSAGEPMTPPTTPPAGESQLAHSPKSRPENPWKKMGMKLGFKKRSGNGSFSTRSESDE